MASTPPNPPGFSPQRRLKIFCTVVLSILACLALVVMANYEAARHPLRFYWSSQTQTPVSARTASLLRSLTNQIKVTVYYDRDHEPLYSSICALLEEYRLINPGISIEKVDYVRNPSAALRVKTQYKLAGEDKDLVIFDCEGHGSQSIPGDSLGDYNWAVEQRKGEDREFVKHLKGFRGDIAFSTLILGVTSPRILNAGFLEGHKSASLEGTGADSYGELKQVLMQNWVYPRSVSLLGTNTINPTNCNLLIIAGAQAELLPEELSKVREYLVQGGRLLLLFHPNGRFADRGLEALMAEWGVRVSASVIVDKANSGRPQGLDIILRDFARNHPTVAPLSGSAIYVVSPRPVGQLMATNQAPGAPKVTELVFTSTMARATSTNYPAGKAISVAVAVERAGVKGDLSENGGTRMVVVGESMFLNNAQIDDAGNRDFATAAVNWLMEQNQMLNGVGPQLMTEYKLIMTRAQLTSIQWLFLAGMPFAILFIGLLVWLRRRH